MNTVVTHFNKEFAGEEISHIQVRDNDYWINLSLWQTLSIRTQHSFSQLWIEAIRTEQMFN